MTYDLFPSKSSAIPTKAIRTIKGRNQYYKRVGGFNIFKKLYDPLSKEDSTYLFEFKDIPETIDPDMVWSIVEGDNYKWYIVPGFRVVNHTGHYFICNNARGVGHHSDYSF